MSGRAARLAQRAQETARAPRPARLAAPKKPGYRPISISLYTDQLHWTDAVAQQLAAAGYPKANRSLVIQEAILQLQARMRALGLDRAEDVAEFFRQEYITRRRASLHKA
jgi:hypothetical protein